MNILDRITQEACEKIKREIELAHGNEVFFRGLTDENMMVYDVEVIARGNEKSVPAIISYMKKREVIIHNHPSGYLYPSDADVAVASMYANKKKGGSYIVNNDVNDIYVIVELKEEIIEKIDIAPFFEKGGLLSQVFSEFEYRHEQLEMAKIIEMGLNDNKKLIVEAGTGTGKTLAYLIPAIEWAIKNEKKVVVTTNTINLQEQLLNKDIPIIKKVIPEDFKYILVKGRGNYVCLRKYINLNRNGGVNSEDFSESQMQEIEKIKEWIPKTKTGDKAELYFEPSSNVWELFASETDICTMNKCPNKHKCFFMKSREEKEEADLLITNHHMYFSDLAIRKEVGFNTEFSIIPNYDLVIFDEAHNIEKVARDYFSYEVSKYAFTKAMNNIYRIKPGKSKNLGHIYNISYYIKKKNKKEYEKIKKYINDVIIPIHEELFRKGNDYFIKLMELYSGTGSINLRLRPEKLLIDDNWNNLKKFESELYISYNTYIRKQREFNRILKDYEDEEGIINDYRKYVDRIENYFMNFKFITEMEDEKFIYWLSTNIKRGNAKLVATPLKITNELKTTLYENLDKIIFTSATIAIGKDFNYFKESIGLDEETYEKIIHSPFDYDKQMKVYIPKDIPDPNARDFLDKIQNFVIKLIEKAKGNTFLLFTSYSSLNYLYYLIRDRLEKDGYEIFLQGSAPRNKLINMYKMAEKPVLFGTDSFWEGVDVKGKKLSSVILVKLPFKVPSDPVVEAIIESMNKEGKNAFMEYQIPESIIKFKQGIGRLIRSKEDKGIVTILDNRLYTKRYGKIFVENIPTKNIHYKKIGEI
jgi:ATP-dependent DNA helicase DinG